MNESGGIVAGFADALAQTCDERDDALAEAVVYRQLFLETLAELHDATVRLEGASLRLRQIMGSEPWHTEHEVVA